MYYFLLGISTLSLSKISLLDLGTVPIVWYLMFLIES